jgi:hypothetical protein
MSIKSRVRTAVNALLEDDAQAVQVIHTKDEDVLANGKILDRKDIEDPTLKFTGVKHTKLTRLQTKARNNVDFFLSEYDLPTIANAIQLDGLLNRCVHIYVEQIMKNGYETVSRNEKVQKHIEKRLKEISLLTGISLHEVLTQATRQLVSYGNAFIIKVRSGTKSRFGKPYQLYGKIENPIVGLFVAEATTIEIGLNDGGDVTQYKQKVRGQEVFYDERDVIHLAFNKIPGTLSGMSSILPILDDLRALRKLEEEIEILGFQYSIPLYLYKVGNKDIPPAPGEIEEVSSTVNSMPTYGMLVVPGHHTIEVPSNNNTPVDILEFANHFKGRIFAGLGISPIAMGQVETSNRNTSETLDASMQTVTKSYQAILKNKIELCLLDELVLDGKFDLLLEDVEFNFPEIDLEQQIKYETHIIQKWQNNLISLEESRNEMNYDRKLDEKRTNLQLVEMKKLEAQGEIDSKLAKTKANTSNKVAPANQHGKKTRPKYVRNAIDEFKKNTTNLIFSLTDSMGISDFNLYNINENITTNFIPKLKDQLGTELR